MVFNLLLASTTILLFFFLFRITFNNFFTIPAEIENARLKLALSIPTGAPITVANGVIEMLPLVADKTIKDKYHSSQMKQNIYSAFYSLILFL